jgi:hypothetical protein
VLSRLFFAFDSDALPLFPYAGAKAWHIECFQVLELKVEAPYLEHDFLHAKTLQFLDLLDLSTCLEWPLSSFNSFISIESLICCY